MQSKLPMTELEALTHGEGEIVATLVDIHFSPCPIAETAETYYNQASI